MARLLRDKDGDNEGLASIVQLKLSKMKSEADSERPGRSSSVVERYEMPVYVARVMVLIISTMVVLGLLWAALARVDVIAEAPGKLIPVGDVKPIQPAFDGVIETVLVSEGEQVRQGQPLIVLDRKPLDAEVKKRQEALAMSESELEQHQSAKLMLQAAIDNPGVLPERKVEIDGASQIVEELYSANSALRQANEDQLRSKSLALTSDSETALLLQQLNHLSDEKLERSASLRNRINELHKKHLQLLTQRHGKQEELASAQLDLGKVKSILAKTQREAAAFRAVFQEGGMSMIDCLQSEQRVEEQERELIKQNSTINKLTSDIEVSKAEEAELQSQINTETAERQAQIKNLSSQIEAVKLKLRDTGRHFSLTKSSFEAALSKTKAALNKEDAEIVKTERHLAQSQSELLQAQHSFDQSEIKAPVTGTVTAIKTVGPGQVVRQAQALMTVVPASCPLVVEAKVPNKDIGFVRKGQRARLKLAAFPYQDYGILTGTVTGIEQHPQEDQKVGSYYKVIIVPKQDWIMVAGKRIHFTSGASVTAEIVIRRKSVLNVILEPIKKASDIHWIG